MGGIRLRRFLMERGGGYRQSMGSGFAMAATATAGDSSAAQGMGHSGRDRTDRSQFRRQPGESGMLWNRGAARRRSVRRSVPLGVKKRLACKRTRRKQKEIQVG